MPTPIEILDRFLVILEDDDPVRITLEALRDGVELKDPRATEEARIILEDWVKNRPKEEKSFTEVIDSALERTLEAKRMERAGFGYYGEPNGRTRDDTQVAKGDGVRRPKIFRSDSDPGDNEPPRTKGSSLAEYSRSLEGSGGEGSAREEEGMYGENAGRANREESEISGGETESVGATGEPVGRVSKGKGGLLDGLDFREDGANPRFNEVSVHELLADIPIESDDELDMKGRVNAPIYLQKYPHLPGLEENITVIAIDPAAYGDDHATILVRIGCHMVDLRSFSACGPMELVGHVLESIEEYPPDAVVTDTTGGMGLAINERLRELGLDEKISIEDVEFQASPRDPTLKCRNARSEMYVLLLGRFRSGNLSVSADAELLEELGHITYTIGSGGLIEITKKSDIKKTLGRSPDRADALALSFYETGSLEVY